MFELYCNWKRSAHLMHLYAGSSHYGITVWVGNSLWDYTETPGLCMQILFTKYYGTLNVILSIIVPTPILKSLQRNNPRSMMCTQDYKLLCTRESCWLSSFNPTHLNKTMLKYQRNFCSKVKTKYNLATSGSNPSRSRKKSTISMLKMLRKELKKKKVLHKFLQWQTTSVATLEKSARRKMQGD